MSHYEPCEPYELPSAILEWAQKRAAEMESRDQTEPSQLGNCPVCKTQGALLNVRKQHYFICEEHKVYWPGGYNLFSTWRHETAEEWAANVAFLKECEEVQDYPWTPEEMVQWYADRNLPLPYDLAHLALPAPDPDSGST